MKKMKTGLVKKKETKIRFFFLLPHLQKHWHNIHIKKNLIKNKENFIKEMKQIR